MKYRSIKRIIHRLSKEIVATRRIVNVTSWSDAFSTLIVKVDIQIMNYNGYKETQRIKQHLHKMH